MRKRVNNERNNIIKVLKNIFWDVDIDAYKEDIPSLDVLKQQGEENKELIEKLEADTLAREKRIENKRKALEKKYATTKSQKTTKTSKVLNTEKKEKNDKKERGEER